MARRPFGGTTADVAQDVAGDRVAGAQVTVWTAATGGTKLTDLQTPAGVALAGGVVASDANGIIAFLGPADGTAVVYVDGGLGGRTKMVATDLADRVGTLESTPGGVVSVAGRSGTVVLSKADVGLGNVDNTADASKPVSTSQQTALNLKANLASPALTGTPTAPTPATSDNSTTVATTAFVKAAAGSSVASPAAAIAGTGIGYVRKGVNCPAGALDVFRAARDLAKAGSARCEIIGIGDSTTYGASTPGYYSWLNRLFDRFSSDGYPDGGAGYVHENDWTFSTYPQLTHDGTYPMRVSATGFGPAVNFSGGFTSTTGNGTDSITLRAPGTSIRLFLGQTSVSGKVAYSVDGGSETIVDCLQGITESGETGRNPYDFRDPILITGLSGTGTHDLTVRSAGLSDIRQPVYSATNVHAGRFQNAQLQAGGSLTNGQGYQYQVTAVSAAGESAPVTIPGTFTATSVNKTFYVQMVVDLGYTGIKLYRRLSGGGAYGLVTTIGSVAGAGGITAITDDGTATAGVAPPVSSTLGTHPLGKAVDFWCDFLKSNGVVIHRYAFNGATTTSFFDSVTSSAASVATTPAQLGFPSPNSALTSANGFYYGRAPGAKPQFRDPKLVMIQLGTNNFGSSTGPIADGKLATYLENLMLGVRACKGAGADVVLIAPHYEVVATPGYASAVGEAKMALKAFAEANGCAWVDFSEALGPVNTWAAKGYSPTAPTNPHVNTAAYQAMADFIYDNLLKL